MTAPSQIPYSDENVPVSISAEYTFGDAIEGTAKFILNKWGDQVYTKNLTITEGQASFEIPLVDLKISPDGYWYFSYSLEVTDFIFGTTATTQGNFQVLPYRYNINFNGNQFVTPGSTYSYSVSVVGIDGSSLAPSGTKVSVTIYPMNIQQELTLNSAGSASSSVVVPKDATYLNFVATAKGCNQGYGNAYVQTGAVGTIVLYPNLRDGET